MILYDPWWNPAVERQAMDRTHRIGQDKPVFVHRPVAAGTVEEKILDMQSRKQALADALFDKDGDRLARCWTRRYCKICLRRSGCDRGSPPRRCAKACERGSSGLRCYRPFLANAPKVRRLQPRSLGQVYAEPVAATLIAAGHFG